MTPGLMIAAPRSGSGKTTLALGLMRALRDRGLRIAAAKSGPDYIDPAFHRAATGGESVNLDSWAMPPSLISGLAQTAVSGADILIAEASMGLFDGVPGKSGRTGASADIAAILGLPVVLLIDVSGQAQSAAAIVKGCCVYDPRIVIGGVVLNRVASERHRRLVSTAIEALGLPVLGALPRAPEVTLPERHLGLVQAEETEGLDQKLAALAGFVREHVDLDAVVAMAGLASIHCGAATKADHDEGNASLDGRIDSRSAAPALQPPGQRIAIARDAAFTFVYPHLLQGWRSAGAEMTFFSPLKDEPPPPDADVCWLPGGYPELHAGRLAASGRFLQGLRKFARDHAVHGECGGYMVLGRALTDATGASHAMADLLSVETSFAKRRMTLGYRRASLCEDGPLGRRGDVRLGHEFHYATIATAGSDAALAMVSDAYAAEPVPVGSRRGRVSGSFFHVIAQAP